MTIRQRFDAHFSRTNLRRIYDDIVRLSPAIGIDGVSHRSFSMRIDDNLDTIIRKVGNGTYHFTKYRLKLVSKGRGKVPREISIPGIRDRVVLRALCEFLVEMYNETVYFELPQRMIRRIKGQIVSGEYSAFLKLDVENFYPTVKHDELISRLRRRVRDEGILGLVSSAIRTATVSKSKASDQSSERGIPQGLSISNILSAIYLMNIDGHFRGLEGISYYRFVDDIFVLGQLSESRDLCDALMGRFRRIGLTVHSPYDETSEKSVIGRVREPFGYLGYRFDEGRVGVRDSTVEKLMESLISIFTHYKYKGDRNLEFLLWRINLRITGCIFQNKGKGWVFYFSEMDDQSILFNLDRFLVKLCARFEVNVVPKSFVRSYFEIRHSKHTTQYIPNFDSYEIERMKDVLSSVFRRRTRGLNDAEITIEFRKRIDYHSRELLTDFQDLGYR